jgi:hypothetical protein
MIEIILLAGAMSVELEPYAVENTEADTPGVGANTAVDGGAFQWTTRRSGVGNSLYQDKNDSTHDGVARDAFGRPVEAED